MEIRIKADNPKGLAYDYLVDRPEKATALLKQIIRQGGTNVTVNDMPIPPSLYSL